MKKTTVYVVIDITTSADGVNAWAYYEYAGCRVFADKRAAEEYAKTLEETRIEEKIIE